MPTVCVLRAMPGSALDDDLEADYAVAIVPSRPRKADSRPQSRAKRPCVSYSAADIHDPGPNRLVAVIASKDGNWVKALGVLTPELPCAPTCLAYLVDLRSQGCAVRQQVVLLVVALPWLASW